MFLSKFFGPHAPPEPPAPIKHTIPTHSTVYNKDYSNTFSNIDSDSDSDNVDDTSAQPYVRPDKTTSSSKSRGSRQLSVKSAAFRVKLQKASKNVPKYLFRMWYEGSGGDVRLNSVSAVTPHAFLRKKGHKSVYDIPYHQFLENAEAHVEGDTTILSEFSSWSQSPHFAFNYAMHIRDRLGNNKTIHIAVMDAEALAESNPAFNVAVLHETFPGEFEPIYHEEHLVRGIVQASPMPVRDKILEVWGKSQSVIYDGTYPKGYEANNQMIRVMRALTHFCWGQEVVHNAVNRNLAPKTSISAIDEDKITSGMSSVRVSPAVGVMTHGTNLAPSPQVPAVNKQQTRIHVFLS
ncbi:hypothetical protein KCU65_g8919, partial [Aureobasidium melanogenum]